MPTPAEIERIVKLAEECMEVAHTAMKTIRFGFDCDYVENTTNRHHLEIELGNLVCAMNYMCEKGDLHLPTILRESEKHRESMLSKLLQQ